MAAIRRLAELTFDHHESHPDFIRLVMIENIHRAEHLTDSESLANLNMPAIEIIGRILERGRAEGVFGRDADAIDVHMMISAFCIFRVANQHTFGTIFGRDLMAPELRARYRADARRHGRRLPARRRGLKQRRDLLRPGAGARGGSPGPARSRGAARNASWSASSTPSATAVSSSACASCTIAVTIADARASPGTPRRNERSILSSCTGRSRRRASEEKSAPKSSIASRRPVAVRRSSSGTVRAGSAIAADSVISAMNWRGSAPLEAGEQPLGEAGRAQLARGDVERDVGRQALLAPGRGLGDHARRRPSRRSARSARCPRRRG